MSSSKTWDRLWFPDHASLIRLGYYRILLLMVVLADVYNYAGAVFLDAEAVTRGSGVRSWNPILLFDVLGLQGIDYATAQILFVVLIVAIVMGILGLFTRTTCIVIAVLWLYWTGLVYSYGKPHHDKIALAFALCSLPLGPIGARISIDAFIRNWLGTRRGGWPLSRPRCHALALFPIRLAQITLVFGYAFAGWSKIAISGFDWANGYSLMGMMMGHDNDWSQFFSTSPQLCQYMSIGTLAMQATFPLILFHRRLLWFYLPAATTFHLMTWQTMDTGPYNTLWMTLWIAFVPLDRVLPRLHAWWQSQHILRRLAVPLLAIAPTLFAVSILFLFLPWPWILPLLPLAPTLLLFLFSHSRIDVVFDGHCGLCKNTVASLLAFDWARRLRYLDLRDWDQVQAKHPQLDFDACERDIHVVLPDGSAHPAVDGYLRIAARIPLFWPFLPCFRLRPIRALADRIYRHIADNRLQKGCGDDSCPIHIPPPE